MLAYGALGFETLVLKPRERIPAVTDELATMALRSTSLEELL